jgi:hypothetical protein
MSAMILLKSAFLSPLTNQILSNSGFRNVWLFRRITDKCLDVRWTIEFNGFVSRSGTFEFPYPISSDETDGLDHPETVAHILAKIVSIFLCHPESWHVLRGYQLPHMDFQGKPCSIKEINEGSDKIVIWRVQLGFLLKSKCSRTDARMQEVSSAECPTRLQRYPAWSEILALLEQSRNDPRDGESKSEEWPTRVLEAE